MSIHDELTATSDSFWEIGKYSRTVKRSDNGHKLCDNLRQLIEQRAEIEKGYSKSLLAWTKKWNEFLDKGPEYGTTQGMWRGLLEEASSTADLHTNVAENLLSKVYQGIKSWQKENYHKSMMHFKETKEFEDGFKKAQKPWEKKYTKVMQNRKEYHTACKAEKSTANQVNNLRSDDSVAIDSKRKMEERLSKCQQEVSALKDKYDASLNDINNYNAKYIEDMTEVFQKCQEFEKKRIEFFKGTFYELHQCLDMSVDPRFPQIYTDLHNTIGKTNSDQDLRWWSDNNGAEMAMNWPQFEEYSPDLQTISKKEKRSQLHSNDGITITSIRHKGDFAPTSDSTGEGGSLSRQSPQSNNSDTQVNSRNSPRSSFPQTSYEPEPTPAGTYNGQTSEPDSNNPFFSSDTGSEDSPKESPRLADPVLVRAVFDYDAVEPDEFTFKSGEEFYKLSEEDELGWCKGLKDGVEKLYPANYVKPVSEL